MFAYCLNNPICHVDSSGLFSRYIPIPGLEVCPERSYIINQHEEPTASKHLGVTTVSHGGCGVVASYNALITLGESKDFDDVLAYYNANMRDTLGWGLVGLSVDAIADYFSSLGYIVIAADDAAHIDFLAQIADASIVYYEFPQDYLFLKKITIHAYGAHFVEYHRSGDGFAATNTVQNNGVTLFTSPYDFGYSGTRFYAKHIFIFKRDDIYEF